MSDESEAFRRADIVKRAIAILILTLPAVFASGAERPPIEARKPNVIGRGLVMIIGENTPSAGLREFMTPAGRRLYLHPTPVIDSSDVSEARAMVDRDENPAVAVNFRHDSGERIRRITSSNSGKLVAIFVDGKLVIAPILQDTFQSHAIITGRFSQKECGDMADAINHTMKSQIGK